MEHVMYNPPTNKNTWTVEKPVKIWGLTSETMHIINLQKDKLVNLFMWVKQYHKPPMTGNGKHTTHKNCDLKDGSVLFYPNYTEIS